MMDNKNITQGLRDLKDKAVQATVSLRAHSIDWKGVITIDALPVSDDGDIYPFVAPMEIEIVERSDESIKRARATWRRAGFLPPHRLLNRRQDISVSRGIISVFWPADPNSEDSISTHLLRAGDHAVVPEGCPYALQAHTRSEYIIIFDRPVPRMAKTDEDQIQIHEHNDTPRNGRRNSAVLHYDADD